MQIVDGRVDEDFDKFSRPNQFARHAPLGTERRNKGHQNDQSGIHEQFCRLADTANILHTVGIGEAKVPVEAVADIVAVEQIGVAAIRKKFAFNDVGNGGFAGAGQAGEPQYHRLLALVRGTGILVHVQGLPMDIGGAAQAEVDHAGADGGIGEAVDDDKAAGIAIVLVGIKGDRLRQARD